MKTEYFILGAVVLYLLTRPQQSQPGTQYIQGGVTCLDANLNTYTIPMGPCPPIYG